MSEFRKSWWGRSVPVDRESLAPALEDGVPWHPQGIHRFVILQSHWQIEVSLKPIPACSDPQLRRERGQDLRKQGIGRSKPTSES